MATRKGKSARPARKAAPAKQPAGRRATAPAAAPVSSNNPNRLLREAAWSAMFGRLDSKNPFTR
jgi:hypothetical protein